MHFLAKNKKIKKLKTLAQCYQNVCLNKLTFTESSNIFINNKKAFTVEIYTSQACLETCLNMFLL